MADGQKSRSPHYKAPPPPPRPSSSQARALLYQKLLCSLREEQALNPIEADPSDVRPGTGISQALSAEWKDHLEQALDSRCKSLLEHFDDKLARQTALLRELHASYTLPVQEATLPLETLSISAPVERVDVLLPHQPPDLSKQVQQPLMSSPSSTVTAAFEDLEESAPKVRQSKRRSTSSRQTARTDSEAYQRAVDQIQKQGPRSKAKTNDDSLFEVAKRDGMSAASRYMVNSFKFEVVFAGLVAINSVTLGIQVELSSTEPNAPEPVWFLFLQVFFVLIFLSELLVRIVASGKSFWFLSNPDWIWNYSDTTIVVLSTTECILTIASSAVGGSFGNLRILRIFRLARVVRAVRIVRLVRFVRALRTLVSSIASTMRPLLWAMFLLAMIIYVFSVMFTDVVTGHLAENFSHQLSSQEEDEVNLLKESFGSLHTTIHTLLRCVSGGVDWGDPAGLVFQKIGVPWGYLFVVYVTFCTFAVLNVMTGVFCEAAIQAARADQVSVLQDVSAEQKRQAKRVSDLFDIICKDNPEEGITLRDIEESFENDKVATFFRSLELDCHDAWLLFQLIDTNGDGSLDSDEFLKGCLRLRGGAKCIDVKSLMKDTQIIKDHMQAMDDREAETKALLEDIRYRLGRDR
eukprot:TRINITY_DN25189_c0_g1_i1.p1 TRINITY_DN25189_c0_g1~~TRINITY_DN25189_c0_g1_i1.p1  ORF type:complete len:634 (-),score=102.82 TRINITY_DN25189_c0_g1_i1:63-1964(-)